MAPPHPMLSRGVLLGALALAAPVVTIPIAGTALAANAGPATTFVRERHETLTKLLGEKPSADRDKKLDAELASLLDGDEMVKGVLGAFAATRKPDEIAHFGKTLKQLIQIAYRKKLDAIKGWSVEYVEEVADGNDTKVITKASKPGDKKASPIDIAYVVRKKGTTFVVVDFVPGEMSWVQHTRKEIAGKVKELGWDGMMKKLDAKLSKETGF